MSRSSTGLSKTFTWAILRMSSPGRFDGVAVGQSPGMTPERRSERANFGEPLDRELVGPAGVPADGGFPCGPCLRGNIVRVVVDSGGVVWQHQVEVGDVDVRLVPVDQRDPIRSHPDVARVGVAVDDAPLSSGE